MKTYKKICGTCYKEFVTTSKNQQYCCVECRPRTHKKYPRYKHRKIKCSTLNDVVKEAHEKRMTYGQYVAQQYIQERMNKNDEQCKCNR